MRPLIHIGYHKTGSTWLQRRLFAHPEARFESIPLRTIKQVFVTTNPFTFDTDKALSLLDPHLSLAREHAKVPVVSHERLAGQPMHGGIDARIVADRLYETFPEGRVLAVIRDQRAILLSIYRQITTRGLNRDTFDQFLEHRVINRNTPLVLEFLEYHHLIRYYQSLFGADRVLVLPYESLHDADGFANRITRFAGVPDLERVSGTAENVGLPSAAIAVVRYLNIAVRTTGLERWLTGPRARPGLVSKRLKAIRMLRHVVPAPSSRRIDQRWRQSSDQILGDRFVESNLETAELTGLDLGALGYMVARQGDTARSTHR